MAKKLRNLQWCEFMVDNKEDARTATSALAAAGYTVFVSDIRQAGDGFGDYIISAEKLFSKGNIVGIVHEGPQGESPKRHRKNGDGKVAEIVPLEFLQIDVHSENDARQIAGIFGSLGRPTSINYFDRRDIWTVSVQDTCGHILSGELWDEDRRIL